MKLKRVFMPVALLGGALLANIGMAEEQTILTGATLSDTNIGEDPWPNGLIDGHFKKGWKSKIDASVTTPEF